MALHALRHTRNGYPREMLDPEIEAATRVLLEAAGDEGRFGQLVRDPVTGEVELVLAARGDAVKPLLAAVAQAGQRSWPQRLLRSLASR
jgi:hypothetical protein